MYKYIFQWFTYYKYDIDAYFSLNNKTVCTYHSTNESVK